MRHTQHNISGNQSTNTCQQDWITTFNFNPTQNVQFSTWHIRLNIASTAKQRKDLLPVNSSKVFHDTQAPLQRLGPSPSFYFAQGFQLPGIALLPQVGQQQTMPIRKIQLHAMYEPT